MNLRELRPDEILVELSNLGPIAIPDRVLPIYEVAMKRLVLAFGLVALAFSAATPARADFAVAKFDNGYCRVWTDTTPGPADGRFLSFKHRDHRHTHFRTWDGADKALHLAVAQRRCAHGPWWWL